MKEYKTFLSTLLEKQGCYELHLDVLQETHMLTGGALEGIGLWKFLVGLQLGGGV